MNHRLAVSRRRLRANSDPVSSWRRRNRSARSRWESSPSIWSLMADALEAERGDPRDIIAIFPPSGQDSRLLPDVGRAGCFSAKCRQNRRAYESHAAWPVGRGTSTTPWPSVSIPGSGFFAAFL